MHLLRRSGGDPESHAGGSVDTGRVSQAGQEKDDDPNCKDGYTLVTLPRIVTPYRDSVDGTPDRVTYQKLVTR